MSSQLFATDIRFGRLYLQSLCEPCSSHPCIQNCFAHLHEQWWGCLHFSDSSCKSEAVPERSHREDSDCQIEMGHGVQRWVPGYLVSYAGHFVSGSEFHSLAGFLPEQLTTRSCFCYWWHPSNCKTMGLVRISKWLFSFSGILLSQDTWNYCYCWCQADQLLPKISFFQRGCDLLCWRGGVQVSFCESKLHTFLSQLTTSRARWWAKQAKLRCHTAMSLISCLWLQGIWCQLIHIWTCRWGKGDESNFAVARELVLMIDFETLAGKLEGISMAGHFVIQFVSVVEMSRVTFSNF